jgi:hypothetical protein
LGKEKNMPDTELIIHAIRSADNMNIEKYLRREIKKRQNSCKTVMQPEENAIVLIDDLRQRGFLT